MNCFVSISDCKPKVFYLLSRHATRYPDKDWIVQIIDILPTLKDKIVNSFLSQRGNKCQLSKTVTVFNYINFVSF